MFLAYMLSWWYGNGLLGRLRITRNRLKVSADFFSVKILLSTLFAPYKQISAGRIDGPIGIKVRAFFDRLLSRFIGATIRSFMIIFGLAVMALQSVFGGLIMLTWLVLPLMPAGGLILWVIGWMPV